MLKVGALLDDEREIFIGEDVSKDDNLNEIVLVASPEIMYEEEKRNPNDLQNVTPHTFRHKFCTQLCENISGTNSLMVVQSVKGLTRITTTLDIYIDEQTSQKHITFM